MSESFLLVEHFVGSFGARVLLFSHSDTDTDQKESRTSCMKALFKKMILLLVERVRNMLRERQLKVYGKKHRDGKVRDTTTSKQDRQALMFSFGNLE